MSKSASNKGPFQFPALLSLNNLTYVSASFFPSYPLLSLIFLQISLFLDILMCLCSDVSETQFISEERPGSTSPTGPQGAAVRSARAVLWKTLRGTPLSMGSVV